MHSSMALTLASSSAAGCLNSRHARRMVELCACANADVERKKCCVLLDGSTIACSGAVHRVAAWVMAWMYVDARLRDTSKEAQWEIPLEAPGWERRDLTLDALRGMVDITTALLTRLAETRPVAHVRLLLLTKDGLKADFV